MIDGVERSSRGRIDRAAEEGVVGADHPVVESPLCATQRSGSTLLCELLKGSEVAGTPDEYFEALRATSLPRQPRQYFEGASNADVAAKLPPIDPGRPEQAGEFEGWFTYALRRGTSPNGVFGAKMMWNYFDDFRDRVRELSGLSEMTFNEALTVLFPRLRIVFVRRRDKVAQAVSLWRAIQTRQWRNEAEPPEGSQTAEYDYRAIKHLVNDLHHWDARWEDWFHATGRQPIRVIYEEFVHSRAVTLGRVLDDLGVDPRQLDGEKGPVIRQSDNLSHDWVSRFREDDAEYQLTS